VLIDLPSDDFRRPFQKALLHWFRKAKRDLPWRQDRDPYRIWVSEIMLQQTQVATVIPYFERFLAAFPTLADLAAADEQAVLRIWEGLGYYRRARDLHRAAQLIVAEHGGQFPREAAVLRALPGIGRYTMGAILSQAFDQRLPILEANSQRVLCRLFGLQEDPRVIQGWLWEAAQALLPKRRAGDFNQALMELGALVCTPVQPRCTECPVTNLCMARRLGIQEEVPLRATSPKPIVIQEAAAVVRRRGEILLVQRPSVGRWAGMWEFPHGPLHEQETHEEAAARLVADLAGVQAAIGAELLTLRHSVTHHRITLVCFEARAKRGEFRSEFYQQGRWVRPSELPSYPVSAPQRRLALALTNPNQQRGLF
jgi:A/G-specific adenine glycosylase